MLGDVDAVVADDGVVDVERQLEAVGSVSDDGRGRGPGAGGGLGGGPGGAGRAGAAKRGFFGLSSVAAWRRPSRPTGLNVGEGRGGGVAASATGAAAGVGGGGAISQQRSGIHSEIEDDLESLEALSVEEDEDEAAPFSGWRVLFWDMIDSNVALLLTYTLILCDVVSFTVRLGWLTRLSSAPPPPRASQSELLPSATQYLALDVLLSSLYSIEVVLRVFVYGQAGYFRNGAMAADFVVVALSTTLTLVGHACGLPLVLGLARFLRLGRVATVAVIARERQFTRRFQRNEAELELLLAMEKSEAGKLIKWRIESESIALGEKMGLGGFGEVYMGLFRGTLVAVKQLFQVHNPDSDGAALTIEDEAVTLVNLRHPNVVLFMGFVHEPAKLWIVMEYCSRGSLREQLSDSSTRLTRNRILKFALGAARGLAYLHGQDPPVLHLDLKTANILISSGWDAKLADFGLSRTVDNIQNNTFAGTVQYSAPEILEANTFSSAADIYSFGICLWELAARQLPFQGISVMEVLWGVVKENLRPDLSLLAAKLPGDQSDASLLGKEPLTAVDASASLAIAAIVAEQPHTSGLKLPNPSRLRESTSLYLDLPMRRITARAAAAAVAANAAMGDKLPPASPSLRVDPKALDGSGSGGGIMPSLIGPSSSGPPAIPQRVSVSSRSSEMIQPCPMRRHSTGMGGGLPYVPGGRPPLGPPGRVTTLVFPDDDKGAAPVRAGSGGHMPINRSCSSSDKPQRSAYSSIVGRTPGGASGTVAGGAGGGAAPGQPPSRQAPDGNLFARRMLSFGGTPDLLDASGRPLSLSSQLRQRQQARQQARPPNAQDYLSLPSTAGLRHLSSTAADDSAKLSHSSSAGPVYGETPGLSGSHDGRDSASRSGLHAAIAALTGDATEPSTARASQPASPQSSADARGPPMVSGSREGSAAASDRAASAAPAPAATAVDPKAILPTPMNREYLALIERCWAADPAQRPTANEVVWRLVALIDGSLQFDDSVEASSSLE
ncbi:hypothetical protein I4F81_011097 [Pyropia yezoensis]|uniref:Uncharacterized protein n=1 Tax=Pyropia yezoensis TaxID=2788 RepID=A0ACC3CEJ5_PYRYE|nr:hypothetical protein I4F81_011097 [Neopyropia yezoensis]